jgi:hypothetical protein
MKFEKVAEWLNHIFEKFIKTIQSKFYLFNFFINTHKFF